MVNSAVKRLLDPVLSAVAPMLLLRAAFLAQRLPQPRDTLNARVDGSDPDRILLVGGGTAVGYGVLTHELALAGHLGRQVSAVTGRGIDVDVLAHSEFTLQSVLTALSAARLEQYDAVVLTLGVTDALRRTPVRRWRSQLSAVLDEISDRTPANAHALVVAVAVQPVRTVATFDNLIGLFAEVHGRALNRESVKVCSDSSHATYVSFNPRVEATERYRSSNTYALWARQISPTLVGVLQDSHPSGNFVI